MGNGHKKNNSSAISSSVCAKEIRTYEHIKKINNIFSKLPSNFRKIFH